MTMWSSVFGAPPTPVKAKRWLYEYCGPTLTAPKPPFSTVSDTLLAHRTFVRCVHASFRERDLKSGADILGHAVISHHVLLTRSCWNFPRDRCQDDKPFAMTTM